MMERPEDMWAWAHEQPVDTPTQVDAGRVLAVLVAHNGEQWLPRTLVAIARLETRPGRLVAVDGASRDNSRTLLQKAQDEGIVHQLIDTPADSGFGASVAAAIDKATEDGFDPEFLWLLHDDSAPDRSALTELLRSAADPGEEGQLPAIVVPKLLHPKRRNHPDQMSAVGESIAPAGLRVTTVDSGEIDQRQQEPTRVLGASTAGLLVTMAAWGELGGLSPLVPLFRDGVDLGWRANARGMIVRTSPNAALRHVEAGRVGLRDSSLAPDSIQADLAAGMTVVTMHSERPGRTIARLQAQSAVNAVGYLFGKSPSLAAGQMRAAGQLRRNRAELTEVAARYAVEGVDQVPEGLLPDRNWGRHQFFDGIAGRVSDYYYDLLEDDDQGGMIDELTGDDFAGGRRRVKFLSPAIIGMLAMLVFSLVASRGLMNFGLLSGPALLPAPGELADAWSAWARAEPGAVGSNAPWLGFMALGSTLAFGQPDWFATLLVLGGPALAGLTAFHFLRPVMGHGWWAPVLAVLWGALLPLFGATGSGAPGVTVLAIVLPMLGSVLRRWQVAPTVGAEGLRLPATAALLIALVAGFLPLMWVVGFIAVCWVALYRRDLRGGLIAALAPVVLLGPWLPRVFADPGRLLVGADPALRPAGNAPEAWRVLIGSASHPGTPVVFGIVVVGLLWFIGCLGAIRAQGLPDRSRLLLLGVAALAPLTGIVLTRFVVPVAGVTVRPDPTAWTLLGAFGLWLLAVHGIGRPPVREVDDSPEDLARHAQQGRDRSLIGMVAAVALLAGTSWWLIGGTGDLTRDTEPMPSYVTGVMASGRATRTLLVDLSSGTARYNLATQTSPAWGDAENPVPSSDPEVVELVQQVAQQFAQGQPSDDLADRLAQLAVGHVWLRGSSDDAVSNLSSAPHFSVAQADADSWVFTVTTLPSHAVVSDGGVEEPLRDAEVTDSDPDARIVLSEVTDPDWRAAIGDTELTATDSGDWRQAWSTDGLVGGLRTWLQPDWLGTIWQGLVLLVLLIGMAPTAQRAHSPRRALASQGGRGGRQ